MRLNALIIGLLFTVSNSFATTAPVIINGAGATFPYPIYSKWFSDYHNLHKAAMINYQSIGSGGGIRQLLDQTVDFGASDAPMTDEQLSKAKSKVLHVPTVLGAVVLTFNLPELQNKTLKLTGPLIAKIFLGTITKWNDPALVAVNKGAPLPNKPILVVHRSDGSGTTAVFSDYLSKVDETWKNEVGAGPALKWKTGLGGKGNEGVTGLIKQTPGSIGYTELTYANTNKLSVATVVNKSGKEIIPSTDTVSKAAKGYLKDMPADFRISITNSPEKDAYPISSFTYLLVYENMGDKAKAKTLNAFMKWAITTGQKSASHLSYAPLPKELIKKIQLQIDKMQLK